MTDETDKPEPGPLAWTPDDELERGVNEFKRLWPDKWAKWLEWLRGEDKDNT